MSLQPLPIDSYLARIADELRLDANLILTATPGAGKTTRLPPEFLKIVTGQILVLQPRRVAAVSACDRIAEEQGWRVGEEVGYRVRFESKVSARTRLVFMTDAMLLRQMIDDPELSGVDLVVLDEFHERNLNQDLILGCLRELQDLGRNIKILIMSATLDVSKLKSYFGSVGHIDIPGKVFPLEIRHFAQPIRLQTDRDFYERVTQVTLAASRETSGDILVFLPGVGEIRRVEERLLESRVGREVVQLHGSLSLADQRRALSPPKSPRVILATNVAEASVTVQGVDYVIDTGLAKVMEVNPHSGFSSLELTRIALFNAKQRAGRAARQKEGICLRLWTSHEETTQAQEMQPEAMRADLSQALLFLAHLGVSDFGTFAWLSHPPSPIFSVALRFLVKSGALDKSNRLTDLGKQLTQYPLPPRWGLLLALADSWKVGRVGARIAAILNEKDFADRNSHARTECDVLYRLSLLDESRGGRAQQQVLESSHQLERYLKNSSDEADDMTVRKLLIHSQRDRLCRRRGSSDRGLMVGGRGVRLDGSSQVRESEFFIALNGVDLPGQSETLISLACGMSKAFVLEQLKDVVEVREEIEFVEEKGAFFSRRVRTIDGLPIEEPTLTPVDPSLVQDRLAEILSAKWDWVVSQNENLLRWVERWKFFIQHAPEFSEQLGPEQILQAMEHASFSKTKVSQVLAEDLVRILESVLARDLVAEFNKQAPEKFLAPSGFSHRILYREGAHVEVRLQEIFGLNASPRLVFGKIPLTFRLLGPNYRPVQVTSDLANFWKVAYTEVRKELRARYPKHSWPDNPLTAKPEAKGRRRD